MDFRRALLTARVKHRYMYVPLSVDGDVVETQVLDITGADTWKGFYSQPLMKVTSHASKSCTKSYFSGRRKVDVPMCMVTLTP